MLRTATSPESDDVPGRRNARPRWAHLRSSRSPASPSGVVSATVGQSAAAQWSAGAGDSAARENDDNGSEEKRDHIRPSFNVRGTNGLGGVHSRHLSGDCDGDRAEATEGRSRAMSTTSGWRPTTHHYSIAMSNKSS